MDVTKVRFWKWVHRSIVKDKRIKIVGYVIGTGVDRYVSIRPGRSLAGVSREGRKGPLATVGAKVVANNASLLVVGIIKVMQPDAQRVVDVIVLDQIVTCDIDTVCAAVLKKVSADNRVVRS